MIPAQAAPSARPRPLQAPERGGAAFVLAHFLAARLLYLVAAAFSQLLVTHRNAHRVELPPPGWWWELYLRISCFSDSSWYVSVMRDGYAIKPFSTATQENWAFFPIYPLLIRSLGSSLWVGILVSHAATWTALWLLFGAVRRRFDLRTARWSVLLMAYFPTSWFPCAFRPDGLLLLLTVLTFVLAERDNLVGASVCGFLCILTKQNGAVLAPALWAWFFLRCGSRIREVRLTHYLVAFVPAAAGLALLSAYQWRITGDPLAWAKIHAAWGRTTTLPFRPALGWLRDPVLVNHWGWNLALLNYLAAVGVLCAGLLMLRRWRDHLDYSVFCLGMVLLAFCSGSEWNFLRYTACCWPLFVYLARACGEETLTILLAAASGFLALFGAWIALDVHAAMG